MIISIGADHAGFIFKEPIKKHLKNYTQKEKSMKSLELNLNILLKGKAENTLMTILHLTYLLNI